MIWTVRQCFGERCRILLIIHTRPNRDHPPAGPCHSDPSPSPLFADIFITTASMSDQ